MSNLEDQFKIEDIPVEKPICFIGIDTETTGLHIEHHGVCQVGAWATGNSIEEFKGYFVSDCNPHYPTLNGKENRVRISSKALKVNGFTEQRIDKAPHLYIVLKDLHTWLNKWNQSSTVILVGSQVAFDLQWLRRDFHRIGLDDKILKYSLDTMATSYFTFDKMMGLGRLAARVGLKNTGAHDALCDAYTSIAAFHKTREILNARIQGQPFY